MISAPAGDVDLRCGGVAMIGMNDEPPAGASLDSAVAEGTALGKRYVDAEGTLELLCSKPGDGSLALGNDLLTLKEAKALPSSD